MCQLWEKRGQFGCTFDVGAVETHGWVMRIVIAIAVPMLKHNAISINIAD